MPRRILPLLLLLPGPAAAQILRTPTEDSITLNRDPVAASDAARKGYVDAQIAAARALLSTGVTAATLGQPGGPAQLGPSGTVPAAQLPVGTVAGTVAAGDALATETSRALAAEAATAAAMAQRATAAALATEAQTARAAEAAVQATAAAAVPAAALGLPNGPARLGADGTLPAAQLPIGTGAGTVAAGNDPRIAGAVQSASLAAVATSGAYGDLHGLPIIPVVPPVGTVVGTLAAGNDPRIAGAAQSASLAAVATSGAYGDLHGLPATPVVPAVGTAAGTVAAGNDPRITGAASAASLATVATSGAYGDLHGLPVIPVVPAVGTAAGTLAAGNDSRIVGAAQSAALATVATSGAYGDLRGQPAIPVVPAVGTAAGILAAGNDSRIVGAAQSAALATVATSGAYGDLRGQPAIPVVPAVGTAAGTVAAGNDARITAALQPGGAVDSSTVAGRTLAVRAAERIDVMDAPYNARGNTQSLSASVTLAAGSKALSTATSLFAATDVGKVIEVTGAGASGATLSASITAYASPTSITLSTGGTTALSASAQTVTWGTDDSPAFAAAITAMMGRQATGGATCVYAPAATYMLSGTALPIMAGQGCILGDGATHTTLRIGVAYSGDVISFTDAWLGVNNPFNGATGVLTGQHANPVLRGFTIAGDRTAPAQQNAVMFYDRADLVTMDDVAVQYLRGRGLASGLTKNQAQSYMRESRITNTRFFNAGSASAPVVEFNSAGGAGTDASNEIDIDAMGIYAPYGTGFVIRNAGSGTIRAIRATKLRVEGLETNPPGIAADLAVLGDPTLTGLVTGVSLRQVQLLDPYAGQAALRVVAAATASQPYTIDVQGLIGGGVPAGNGLVILAGRNMRFDMTDIYTTGTNVVVGPTSAGVGGQIEVTGPGGRENSWTWSVDATAVNSLLSTPLRTGNPGLQTSLGFTLGLHDGSATGGSAIGLGAIDLQGQRNFAGQVASGPQAVLLGGGYNTASGSGATIVGGNSNLATGINSFMAGSSQASDRGRIGSQHLSTGAVIPNVLGSAQAGRQVMTATGTAAMRLTAAQFAANSAFGPIMNIPSNTAYNLSVRLVAIDRTAPGNSYAWTLPVALLTRQAAVGTTALALGTPAVLSVGTGSGGAVAAAADTANGGLSLTFTPPTGTDTWDAFADVASAEVQ